MKTRVVSLTCPVAQQLGRGLGEGVPPRLVAEWILDTLARLEKTDPAAAREAVLLGSEGVGIQWLHTLTAEEVQAERVEELQARLREVAGIVGNAGSLSPDELARIRAILGA